MKRRLSLCHIKKSGEYKVLDIQGGWGIRQRINQLGIHVGDRLLVKRSCIMGGPVLIQIHGMDVALGRGMARRVLLEEK